MHPFPPRRSTGTPDTPCNPATLAHLLGARFGQRRPLQAALLDALFGHARLEQLDAAQRLRLQAVLESRTDAQLEQLARRGDPGRSHMGFQLDVVFDGEPSAAERTAMAQRLLQVLQTAPWPVPALSVRAVLLDVLAPADAPAQDTRASRRCKPSGS